MKNLILISLTLILLFSSCGSTDDRDTKELIEWLNTQNQKDPIKCFNRTYGYVLFNTVTKDYLVTNPPFELNDLTIAVMRGEVNFTSDEINKVNADRHFDKITEEVRKGDYR